MAMESLLMDTLLLAIMAKGLLMPMPDIFIVDTTMDKPLKCLSKSSKATQM